MKVLVEGDADRFLVRSLGVPKGNVLQAGCKGEVIKHLRDRPGDVGMVDEDPGGTQTQPHELTHYREIDDREGLRLLAREGHGGQRLIVVRPRLEDWLIQRARVCGVDPRLYQLPSSAKELHDIPRYEQKDGFQRFLAELNGLDKGMGLLRQWIFQGA